MIQRGMDVFTLDGAYVGTVVCRSKTAPPPDPLPMAMESGQRSGNQFSGESLGPAPTASIGNRGPSSQARTAGFGALSADDADEPNGNHGQMVIFRWLVAQQWRRSGPVLRRLPLDLVQAVSHERVILSVTAEELARR
jgi:hypothetical protein